MSRIHEALKRAEQERSQPIEPSVPPAVPDASPSVAPQRESEPAEAPVLVPSSPLESSSPSDSRVRSHADQFLRFEDIWDACTVVPWKVTSSRSVFAGNANSAAAEQFRTLRSRLYQVRDRTPLKTILVTSALVAEGKTFVASNLAQALAKQKGCKVLLVDADLRCSNLHASLGANSSPGLSDYLAGTSEASKIMQKGLDEYLCFIPGGAKFADPAELLANGRLKQLLVRIAPLFDWVIIDSPPALPVADSMLLADLSDGVVCVVRAAFTDLASAQKSCQQLQQKGLLGIVLNCADEAPSYGAYYNSLPARVLDGSAA
jgi:protein-tyrosine kinase